MKIRSKAAVLLLSVLAGVACSQRAPASAPAPAEGPGPVTAPAAESTYPPPPPTHSPPAEVEPAPPLPLSGTLVPEHAGFPAKRAPEAKCDALSAKAQALVDGLSGPCTTDDDCEVVGSACPFGCFVVAAQKGERSAARAAIDRFFRECPVCKNKCAQPPAAVQCAAGTCVASST